MKPSEAKACSTLSTARPSLRALVLLALGIGTVLLPQGCSAVVSDEVGQVHCRAEGKFGPPACLRGEICLKGLCRSCVVSDICGNGVDDNCNGLVDEGCDVVGEDAGAGGANDTISTDVLGGEMAPGGGGQGAGAGPITAGGSSAAGHPTMTTAGTGGTRVGGMGGAAVVQGGSGGTPDMGQAGAPMMEMAGAGGSIQPPTPALLGASCDGGLSCVDGTCIPLSELQESSSGSICTRPCSASIECGDARDGAICFPTRSGGGACIQSSTVGRPDPGDGTVGADCSGGPTTCRSAFCTDTFEGSICTDVCDDGSCADDSACGVASIPSEPLGARNGFICHVEAGLEADNDVCGTHTDQNDGVCASNLCRLQYQTADYTSYFRCSKTCCNSTECQPVQPNMDEPTFVRSCGYTAQRDQDGNVDLLRTCGSGSPHDGDDLGGPPGTPCTDNTECRGNVCLTGSDGSHYCTDACCTDADCNGLSCKPVERQLTFPDSSALNVWVLRCVK